MLNFIVVTGVKWLILYKKFDIDILIFLYDIYDDNDIMMK